MHLRLLHFGLLLGEDGLNPCALWNLEHLETVVYLFLVHTSWLVQTVLRQCGCADVESALDDVLNALRQRVPSAAEVALQNLDERSC